MKNFYQKFYAQCFQSNQDKRGITIGETLLAIAIMGILAVTVLPGFSKIKKIQVLTNAKEEIVSIVGKARSQTLASLNSSEYGVHFETNRVIIFTGTSFSSEDPNNQVIDLPSPVTISNINLNDLSTNVYFYCLSGLPSTTGTVTLSVPDISPKIITISATGSASAN